MDPMKCIEKAIEKEYELLGKQADILIRNGCNECGSRNFTMCFQQDETGEAIFQYFKCNHCDAKYTLEEIR